MQKDKPGYKTLFLNKFSIILAGEYPQEWTFSPLGNETSGKFSSGVNNDKEDYGQGTLFVNISDVFREFTIDPRKLKRVDVSKEEIENYKLQKDDLVIDRSSNIFYTVGYPSYFPGWDEPVVFSGFTFRYRPNPEYWNSKFLTYQLMSSPIRKFVISISTISANSNVNQNSYKKIVVPRPSLEEQNRIVSILSNVDNLISSYDSIIETTKKIKMGLMQQLLTRGIGHTKFKKVTFGLKYLKRSIPEEWDISRIGGICKSIVPGRNKPQKFDGKIPWITVDDLDVFYVEKSKNNFNVSNEDLKNASGKIIPPNSVLMSCVGDLGIIAINKIEISMNQQLHAFVCPKIIIPFFLAQFLKTMKNYMNAIATTTTVPYMNKNNCESIHIVIPPIDEQQKIAFILNTIDSKINDHESKKSHLEKLKKGLMQKLLTGQIKV